MWKPSAVTLPSSLMLSNGEKPSILRSQLPTGPWLPTGPNFRSPGPGPALTPFGRFFTIRRDMAHGPAVLTPARCTLSPSRPPSRRSPGRRHLDRAGLRSRAPGLGQPLPEMGVARQSDPRKSRPRGAGLSACVLRRRGWRWRRPRLSLQGPGVPILGRG